MSFLSCVLTSFDAKDRDMVATFPSEIDASQVSVELKMAKKQRHYISKLQQLSKKLAQSNEVGPTELPSPSIPQRQYEAAKSEESENDNEETRINKFKEDRQIRYRKKLKALGQLLRETEMANNPNKSTLSDTSCLTSDVSRERSRNDVVNSVDRKSFQLRELCRCCYSMETYVEDVFSADDDIEQLLFQETLDDTILTDEWSLDVSSTPSGQTKSATDGSLAQGDGLSRGHSVQREGSRPTMLFRGDPCEI
ncbi:hypothetical protein HJC23_010419 [Cyclotella cryptica]|uniref:Uncharacterized protein n=1 Tax=Cyclotella cryptica TaxID=29204 RepID=A0ABD3QIS6_9STRA|eukprot:CCRYP_005280-RA/>CCRYP_005280-RA protein AED:0.12 eAED:0.12 QI:0/-1/0/1/-1/1/1/0/251